MEINIQNLIDDTRCYEVVRDLSWPGKTFYFLVIQATLLSEVKMILHGGMSNAKKDSV